MTDQPPPRRPRLRHHEAFIHHELKRLARNAQSARAAHAGIGGLGSPDHRGKRDLFGVSDAEDLAVEGGYRAAGV